MKFSWNSKAYVWKYYWNYKVLSCLFQALVLANSDFQLEEFSAIGQLRENLLSSLHDAVQFIRYSLVIFASKRLNYVYYSYPPCNFICYNFFPFFFLISSVFPLFLNDRLSSWILIISNQVRQCKFAPTEPASDPS